MRRFWVWALGLGVAAALLATGSRISTHMTRPTGELALARALPGRKDIAAELRSERDEQSRRAAEATRVRQPLEVAVERARAISGQMQADGSPGDALQSELRDIEASTYSVPVTARIGTYIGRRGFYPVTVEGLPNGEVLAGGIRPPLTQDAAVLADGAPAYAQYRVVEGAPVRQALVFADGGAMNLRPTEWTRSRRLVSYSGPTLAATFMGSRIVTASGGGRLHVWSPETGMDTAVEIGPHAGRRGSKVVALVVSADGSVAAAARYADVLLHDGQTGRHLRSIPSKTKMAGGLSLSADGARVAFRSEWFAATVWDVEAGAEIASYKETARTAGGVALSPDGALLAAAKRDGTVGVWDIETGRRLHVLAGHTGRVRAIVFTSDAGRLITGSDDATLRVWDAVSGVETAVFKGHEMRVTTLSLSADNSSVLSRSADKTARLWDVRSGDTLHIHHDPRGVRASALSPDGERVALLPSDNRFTLRIVGATSGTDDGFFDGATPPLGQFGLTDDGAFVACDYDGGRAWAVDTGLPAQCVWAASPAASTDPSLAGALRLRNRGRGDVRVGWGLSVVAPGQPWLPRTHSMAIDRAEDGSVRVCDAETRATLHTLPGTLGGSAALSGDGATLVARSWSGSVDVWQYDIVEASAAADAR